jgi:ATP/maltotriose-dependent transcriptional regulator MalT
MQAWGKRAAAAARDVDDPVLVAAGLAACARACAFAGDPAHAEIRRGESCELVDALPDAELARRLDALVHLAGAELYINRFSEAGAHAERALAIGRATGQGQLFPLVFAILGMVWWAQGRIAEAAEPLDGAVEAARMGGNAHSLAWSLYARSKIALMAGDLDLALSTAQEAVDLTRDGKPSHVGGWAAFTLAEASLHDGKADRAVELLEQACGGPDLPLTAESFRAAALELLTRARLALGQPAEAARAAAVAQESADAVGLAQAQSMAARAAAEVALHQGEAPVARERAFAAVASADAAGMPVEAALARALAGRALDREGDREGAVRELEAAAAEFERVGAMRHRDAAERELRRLGRHIHRRSQPTLPEGDGVEALTRRELEIARLIVDRRTNREIAEALFLSPKTVETHIRNIFGKLGADSRVEVARIVERADRLASV